MHIVGALWYLALEHVRQVLLMAALLICITHDQGILWMPSTFVQLCFVVVVRLLMSQSMIIEAALGFGSIVLCL
jgi:hypothetical protein